FNGVSGIGIGGQLIVTTQNVMLATSDIVTVGAVNVSAKRSITFGDSAGLNAGSSTIMLAANQDPTLAGGFTQSSSAVIQTSNNTDQALQILVGGGGNANIS